jgi:hypothetical protein
MKNFTEITADAKAAASKLRVDAKELGQKTGKSAATMAEAAGANIGEGIRIAKTALVRASVVVSDGTRKGVDVAKVAAIATGSGLSAGAGGAAYQHLTKK